MVEHGVQQVLLRRVFAQGPGHGDVDVLVQGADIGPYGADGVVNLPVVHAAPESGEGGFRIVFHFFGGFGNDGVRRSVAFTKDAAVVLGSHGEGAVKQVAQVVGQVGVDTGNETVPAEVAVLSQLDVV